MSLLQSPFGRSRNVSRRNQRRRRTDRTNLRLESLESRIAMAGDLISPALPALVVIANQDFYYQEYSGTRQGLEAAGLNVTVAATTTNSSYPHANSGEGADGGLVVPDIALADVDPSNYSAIAFVGGWGSAAYQFASVTDYANDNYDGDPATREVVNELINGFVSQDKFVAGLCFGVGALAYARVDGVSPLAGLDVVTYEGAAPYGETNGVWGWLSAAWHMEYNGATVLAPGSVGDTTTAADDVLAILDADGAGGFVVGQNPSSALFFGTTLAAQILATTNPADAPVVPTISDQSMVHTQDFITVELPAAWTWTAEVVNGEAWRLDAEYGFYADQWLVDHGYGENYLGTGEKWVQAPLEDGSFQWYMITTAGTVHQWGGSIAASPLIAELGASIYDDPALLTDPAAVPVVLSLESNLLTIDPVAGFVGEFGLRLTASDGATESMQTINVAVTNTAPSFSFADQTITAGDTTEILLTASDADGDQLSFSGSVVGDLASQLDQERVLNAPAWLVDAGYGLNYHGAGEKWVRGIVDGGWEDWYFILPNGDLHMWNNSIDASPLVAELGSQYFDEPALLTDPQLPAAVSISGDTLSITPAAGFVGNFELQVDVNDGFTTVSDTITVSVTDTIAQPPVEVLEVLPVLMVIANVDFYYQEYADTRASLEAAGVPVVVAAATLGVATPHVGSGEGADGGLIQPDVTLFDVAAVQYSTIVFVGGWGSSMYQYAFAGTYDASAYNGGSELRATVNGLIDDFVAQDKYVTALCHGVSVLAWARTDGNSPIAGRTVSAWGGASPSVGGVLDTTRSQIEGNGATMVGSRAVGDPTTAADDVIVDGRIITAENYDSAALFGQVIADLVTALEYVEHVDQIFADWE